MTDAENQLQETLTTTFLVNLAFLSEYDRELYLKVDELSRMIGDGRYKEKYSLEFLIENGEFDIYDIVNNKYLYNKNPKKVINDLIRKVDFDEKYSIMNIAEYFLSKNKNISKTDKLNKFELDNLAQISSLTHNDCWNYANAIDSFIEMKKKRLKKIKKFIFLGTLGGRHIPKIAQKIDADVYLVLEKNLELFRLSLFTVDYTVLASKGVIFSIMDTASKMEQKISSFLSFEDFNNYLIKFSSTSINIEEYVDVLLSISYIIDPFVYNYNRRLYIHINRTTQYLNDDYKILLLNETKNKLQFFKNMPVLFVASGPSLEKNLDWIKNNHNKFFIVTIGSAYKKLIENNIHIDIISTVDEQYEVLNYYQFDDESVAKIDKNTLILASTITSKKILDKFNKENLFLFEVMLPIIKGNRAPDGFSIGEITLDILIYFNIKEIYLIGLDLAVDQETGLSHSKDASSTVVKLDLNIEQNKEDFKVRESLIKVKGNQIDFVNTIPLYYSSIKSIEKKLFLKPKDTKIFNLSKDGAFFEGSTTLNINKFDLTNFNNLEFDINDLSLSLKKLCFKKITSEDKKEIDNELIKIEELIENKFLNSIEKNNYSKFDYLLDDIVKLLEILKSNNLILLYETLSNYTVIILQYLNYCFNDTKIKNEDKKIKKTKEIFINQVRELLKDYKYCIQRLL